MLEALCKEFQDHTVGLTDHYLDQLLARSQPNRADLQFLLCDDDPDIIEYNDDETCLVWGLTGSGRIAHVLCVHPPGGRVVTAYWPDERPEKWTDTFKKRVRTGRR
jgi:hypothetical protein